MKKQTVKVNEAVASLSDLIDRVHYHGEEFEIKQGRDIVARLVPPGPREMPVAELNGLFSELPRLERDDAEDFARILRLLREEMRSPARLDSRDVPL